ncbi:MAG: hypothetical protein H7330_06930 [Hymenobacteraceae bacterium]|nr:hypothetical protein [Hymenobacteraceae bacterium]
MRFFAAPRHWRGLLLAVIAGLYGSVAALLTFCQPADRPATEAAAPAVPVRFAFAPHDPATQYVGTAACAPCHAEITHDYAQTGKGRAFGRPRRGEGPEEFGGPKSVVYDRFSQRYYRAFWRADSLYVAEWQLNPTNRRETTHYRAERVDYVIGSGNQTRSYILARNGYFFELPITWYSARRIWDLSPGYENGQNSGFGRTIGAQCLGCHNSQNELVPNSVNRFTSVGNGMSCESCHGPGAAHVAKWTRTPGLATASGRVDSSIINPAHLPVTAQLDVCRQCHLEGVTVEKQGKKIADYRPGQRLADYADVFIAARPGAATTQFGFASHAERLQLSACFRRSASLTCTTCHNPHQSLGPQPMAVYNAQCQRCHAEVSPPISLLKERGAGRPPASGHPDPTGETPGMRRCSAPKAARLRAADNCVSCHMAKSGTTDIPHVSSRDHLIRRNLKVEAAPTPETSRSQLVVLRSFTVSDDSVADDRARAVAAMLYFEQVEQNPAYLTAVRQQAKALEFDARVKYAYLARDPAAAPLPAGLAPAAVANPYSAYYVGQLLRQQGQPHLPWLARAVALAPANADFRTELAAARAATGDAPGAEAAYRDLLALQPWNRRALLNLGYQRLLAQDYAEALRLTRAAQRQDPTYALAYENEANIYLQQGDAPAALTLLANLEKRFPQQAPKYRDLQARVRAAQ